MSHFRFDILCRQWKETAIKLTGRHVCLKQFCGPFPLSVIIGMRGGHSGDRIGCLWVNGIRFCLNS